MVGCTHVITCYALRTWELIAWEGMHGAVMMAGGWWGLQSWPLQSPTTTATASACRISTAEQVLAALEQRITFTSRRCDEIMRWSDLGFFSWFFFMQPVSSCKHVCMNGPINDLEALVYESTPCGARFMPDWTPAHAHDLPAPHHPLRCCVQCGGGAREAGAGGEGCGGGEEEHQGGAQGQGQEGAWGEGRDGMRAWVAPETQLHGPLACMGAKLELGQCSKPAKPECCALSCT